MKRTRVKWAVAAVAAAGVICATGGLFRTCMKPQAEPIAVQADAHSVGNNTEREGGESQDNVRIRSKRKNAVTGGSQSGAGIQSPGYEPSLDFGESDVETTAACSENPSIERYAKLSGVDPLLVRAVMAVESGFGRCHATKVCQPGYGSSDCANNGPDLRYELGIDEMDDSESGCRLPQAPEINGEPAWRWFGFGLGNTIGAPGEIMSEGSVERECNASFNPFNPDDAACAVSLAMGNAMESGMYIVNGDARVLFRRSMSGPQLDDLAGYIAANIYSGRWYSGTPPNHPACGSRMSYGACLVNRYWESAGINSEYCGSAEGYDDERCMGGEPRHEPPESCYGYTDIVAFARDCELPLRTERPGDDFGAAVMAAYYRLKNECRRRR